MTSEEKDLLEASLQGYKEKIIPTTKTSLKWDKELIFIGRTDQGHEIEFDAEAQWGCRPVEALLLSLAGCMAIDVVMFLRKMRVQLTSFGMDLVGERNALPPQYYKSIDIVFHLTGAKLSREKIDRAVALSRAKYCSVYNSLRKDLDMKVRYVIEDSASV